ncbi:Metallo-hydrolase/oxidoreductase [Aureobasidium sp. EXF-3400]|nr:Metallo-hydrolase/oxidoreductase [Aureobasidium sp. EXF-12344]KAI4770065.1 Metallo-hydrolase/oxidoreductase [Aureobasidium sp. EXF-3400]
MASSLVHLPEIERISSRVIRILGGNPGKFTLQGTNTYLVGQGPTRLLIDTGEGKPSWLSSLKTILSQEKASISQVILTHWHPDHVGGIPDLLSLYPKIPVYKSQAVAGQQEINHGQVFKTQGATLRAFHCPGHTTDHMALVLEEEDAMFTGDNVLGQGTAVFEDLAAYMDSLSKMQHEFSGRAYPGHGPVIEDGKAKIQEYIRHRQEREGQIVDVLGRETEEGKNGWQSMDLVRVIYKGYPENLHAPAERGVLQVLDKLKKEGKVHEDEGAWFLQSKPAL